MPGGYYAGRVSDDRVVAQRTVIGLLGPVSVGDAEVPGLRAKRLVAALALANGRVCSADRLIDDVWGTEPPRSPQAALHTQISRVRQFLGDGSIAGIGSGYRLTGVVTDIELVQELLADGDSVAAATAASYWRGAPGDDLRDGDLAAALRRRADALAARIDDIRAAAAFASGDYAVAREIAERRCADDPLDESSHVLLMRALAAQGRRADALAVFARLRRALSAELGVDPGAEATAAHSQLLAAEVPDSGRASNPAPTNPAVTTSPTTTSPTTTGPTTTSPTTTSPTAMSSAASEPKPKRGKAIGLRAESTALVGRDDDLRRILELLQSHRVVTVLGPGGVGKTRMANVVGSALAAQGKQVYFVPLASVRDNADVVGVIAAALGVGESDMTGTGRPRLAVGELTDRLADAVRGQQVVLMLDNCEQVIDACARLIDQLVATEPGLRVVITSRAPLLIAAEQLYPLSALSFDSQTSSAVELFGQRARAVRPTAALPPAQVMALCEHLDGIPLAIELAAARVRTMSVEEIAQRLAARFELLRSGDRTAPDRHRTLHAVIEWSWELLDAQARTALRRLCLFPAGFSTAAAASVLQVDGPDLDDALTALVNQSLLNVIESHGHVRYRMLEMVREFGEEKLAATSEGPAVVDAMSCWARDFATQMRRRYAQAADRSLVESITADADNLIWVLRCCLDAPDKRAGVEVATIVTVFPVVASFWAMKGLHPEVRSWGIRVLSVLPRPDADLADDDRELWQFTLIVASIHLILLTSVRALAIARYYLRVLHRPALRFELPMEFLSALLLARTPTQALRTLTLGARAYDTQVRALALAARMNIRENAGDLDGALRDHRTLRTINDRSDLWLTAMSDVSNASVFGQQARWSEALPLYRSGVANLAAIGAEEDEAQTRGFLAGTLLCLGRLDEAARELELVNGGWTPADPDPQGNPEILAAAMIGYAELQRLRGESSADTYWRAGELLVREHPHVSQDPGVMMLINMVVVGLTLTGDRTRARRFISTLIDGIDASFAPMGWNDLPQTGVSALAAGLVLAADEGRGVDAATLMLAGVRLGARADYPALFEARGLIRDSSTLSSAEYDETAARVAAMSRRQALETVHRLMPTVV